jgi:CobQ-like glutamine amidotransferase family enzyme
MNASITVGYLYPEILGTFGDRGNLQAVLRRCAWRGICVEVTELGLGGRLSPGEVDLILIGSGTEARQRLIAGDLCAVKGPSIREAVDRGTALLAVGSGYELLGRYCQPADGAELPGACVFDSWTIRRSPDAAADVRTITAMRADRAIGDLVVSWGEELLVGFENHAGRTYLGPTAQPLGKTLAGFGNSGDGWEGVARGCAIGTNLRGPCLPRNPALADFLIRAAMLHRYGNADLAPLDDDLELAAHDVAVERVSREQPRIRRRQCAGSRGGSLPRPGWGGRAGRAGGPGRPARPQGRQLEIRSES